MTRRNISSSNVVVYIRYAINITSFSAIVKHIDGSNLNNN